jgi:DNA-binding NarL/FixJ family response regulator/tetratricopeptide (TPR) repeat protein
VNVPSSAKFISRAAELSQLREVIAGAAGGRPRTVIIGGDAGVGKTRLLREALAGADARVLSGGCVDLAEDSLPYAPFAEALRGLADELEPHDVDGAPLSATGQARMYERLLAVLRRLGEETPVVLAIEDLHWADRSTRDLLRFLAGNLRGERLAILATYRADDLQRGHPLRPLVAELERGGRAERLHLRPFTRAEVAEQIAAILGEPPAPAFVSEVFGRAEGNAFCVEQLVATAREGRGSQLPTLLADILHARFERLTSPAQRMLGVVAAGGPRVREALIAAVCGLVDDERDASLRDAVDHQILAVEGDAYVFRHALLREAAYAQLLPGERHRLHAAYGTALGARPELADGSSLQAELARHWHAADEVGFALAASVAAAAAAERRHGYAEASAHYARALEVWPRVDGPATAAGTCLVALLRSAAEAANLAGESTRAAALIRSALEEIDAELVPDIAGELHERLGRYLWAAGDSEAATGAYEEAVRLVPPLPPSRARARVLGAWGQALMLLSRYDASRERCEEAIAIARSVGARREEGHALNTLGVDLACLGDPGGAVDHLKAARAIAEEVGDLDDLARAYLNLAEILAAPLDLIEEAVEVARDGVALCEEVGLDCDYGVSLRAIAAGALFELGRWDEAEAIVAAAAERSPIECAAIDFHLAGAKVAAGRGPLEAAERHLTAVGELMTNTRDPQYTGPFAARTAELALWRRRPQEALVEALDGLGRADDRWFGAPLLWLGIRAAADVGDMATGERLALRASETLTGRSWVLGAYAASCAAEATRLGRRPDPDAFAAAAVAWDRARRPYPAAYCRFRQAEALLQRRQRRAAAKALAAARAVAERLGASPLLAEMELLGQRGRIGRAPAEEAATEPGPSGLTARELEVLALVARGLTNRDVGKALFVTEKTASAHVSSILSKLSVRSRVEAAAAAHRLGLVEP